MSENFHLLRNRINIRQGKSGLRAGTDAVLLGATPLKADKVLELGCGVAPALLCYGYRNNTAQLFGIEQAEDSVNFAKQNIQMNGCANRATIIQGNFTDVALMREQSIDSDGFDLVMANPPFYAQNSHTPPQDFARQSTHIEETPLKDWLIHALRYTKQFGWLSMIHRPERLPEILYGLSSKAGNIHILPISSRIDQPAKRIMIFAQKSRKDGCTLLPNLVMHDGDDYSPEAKLILEQAMGLNFQLGKKKN